MSVSLFLDRVTVAFGGLTAVRDVSISLERGARLGVIGPNGAGKTTLINAIFGVVGLRTGRVLIDGREVQNLSPHQRARRGLARTFQNVEIFPSMTVVENVLVSLDSRRRVSLHSGDRRARTQTWDVLESLNLTHLGDIQASMLSYPDKKLVELARAIVSKPRILLLDEPTAGVAADEKLTIVQRIDDCVSQLDVALVLVEHDMEVVRRLCANVCVMDAGEVISRGTFAEVTADPIVREAYFGTDLSSHAVDPGRRPS